MTNKEKNWIIFTAKEIYDNNKLFSSNNEILIQTVADTFDKNVFKKSFNRFPTEEEIIEAKKLIIHSLTIYSNYTTETKLN